MACASALLLTLTGCGDQDNAKPEDFNTVLVTLPNGTKIRAERVTHPRDMERGMKYRDSLPADRGMLFIHGSEGSYPYWMYEVKVPLDMIWLNSNRVIVQLVHKVPPCPGPKEKCMSYGGAFPAQYVLELAAGEAARHHLKPGMILDF